MSRRYRVFLDTNVLFSALHSSVGAPNAILEAYLRGQIEVVVSRQVLEELIRTIHQKRPQLITRLYFFLQEAPFEVQADPAPDVVRRWEQVIHGPDAPILPRPVAARPDFLITGNRRHFTPEVAALAGMAIVSPAEFGSDSDGLRTLRGEPVSSGPGDEALEKCATPPDHCPGKRGQPPAGHRPRAGHRWAFRRHRRHRRLRGRRHGAHHGVRPARRRRDSAALIPVFSEYADDRPRRSWPRGQHGDQPGGAGAHRRGSFGYPLCARAITILGVGFAPRSASRPLTWSVSSSPPCSSWDSPV